MEHNRRNTPRRRRRQKNTAGEWMHVLLFYILPFVVFNSLLFFLVTSKPSLKVTVADTKDYLSTEIQVEIHSFLPTADLTLTMDGEPVELTKIKNRSYSALVNKNGSVEATVKNFNGMTATAFEQVNVLDELPPSVENASVIDGILTLTITDSQAGVDFDSIRASDSSGESVEPLSVNRDTNTLSYKMETDSIQIVARDRAGNKSSSTITANNGSVDTTETTAQETEVVAE